MEENDGLVDMIFYTMLVLLVGFIIGVGLVNFLYGSVNKQLCDSLSKNEYPVVYIQQTDVCVYQFEDDSTEPFVILPESQLK